MDATPHEFGGHKAAAIHDSRRALEQLQLARHSREKADNRRGKGSGLNTGPLMGWRRDGVLT